MINFFRKIRKQLTDDNKPLKYMRYAIGEIFLLVIGILIALSINNWNENQKLHDEELNILSDIKTNLISNYDNFKRVSLYNQGDIRRYEKIENYIENDLKYNIELDSAFGVLTFWGTPYITTSSFNTLQDKGLDLIKNERLRQEITEMYEIYLKSLVNDYEKSELDISQIVTPFFSKHIRRLHKKSLRMSRPNNFEDLKRNEEFKNILSMIIRQRKRGMEFYEELMSKTQNLIENIETEINSR